jgi:hypothetical protein
MDAWDGFCWFYAGLCGAANDLGYFVVDGETDAGVMELSSRCFEQTFQSKHYRRTDLPILSRLETRKNQTDFFRLSINP